ncbi:MAG: hypothetical protein IKZ67_00560 [Paludibacteraceae bacterium]|nr:hypothetical protein [Paludibacteraceae bacterium]
MNCTYEVIFDIGEVKDGLFDHDPELNGSLLPCLIESCFGENCVTTVLSGPQLICCKVRTDKNLQETADAIVKKMEQVCPHIAMIHESGDEERINYKLGEKSSVHVSLKNEGEQPQEENDEVDYSVFSNKEELDDIIKNINNLIGWDSFKQFVNEAVPVVAVMHKRDSLDSFKAQNYLFSVNDGCGLTRVINLLTLFEVELGVFSKKFYFEFVLSDETQGRKINVKDLLNILYDKENYDKLVCLDISEFMVKSKQRELKDLLLEISHVSGNFNFVFRVPYIEPHELKKIEDSLSVFGFSSWVCGTMCDGWWRIQTVGKKAVPFPEIKISDFFDKDSLAADGMDTDSLASRFEMTFLHCEFSRGDSVHIYSDTERYLEKDRKKLYSKYFKGNRLSLLPIDGEFKIVAIKRDERFNEAH